MHSNNEKNQQQDKTSTQSISFFDDLSAAGSMIQITTEYLQLSREAQQNAQQLSPDVIDNWIQKRQDILTNLGQSVPIQHLKKNLQLNQVQIAVLLLSVLPCLDSSFKELYAYINGQQDKNYASLDLLANVVTFSHEDKISLLQDLLNDDPLTYWRLLFVSDNDEGLLERKVIVAPDVLQFLLGCGVIETDVNATINNIHEPEHDILPRPEFSSIDIEKSRIIYLQGEQGVGRLSMALFISGQRKKPLYLIKHERLWQFDNPLSVMKDVLRLLILQGGNCYWLNGLEKLCDYPGIIQVLSQWLKLKRGVLFFAEEQESCWPDGLNVYKPLLIHLEKPDVIVSVSLWQHFYNYYLKDLNDSSDIDWNLLSHNYYLSPLFMIQVCLRARQWLLEGKLFNTQLMIEACIASMDSSLSGLAVRIEPQLAFSDFVLTQETRSQLNDIILHYQHRNLLKQLDMQQTHGLQVLFWGQPGTGKTMAAEVLANELSLPLYKADLSNIASKWIGETEKHLAKLFDEAERNNAVLFFDEADAVFSKRSQIESSHDKNANMGVSYLLQRMENYHGILALATNFKGNLDPAFLRRLHASVEFPLPAVEQRLLLWTKTWSDQYPVNEQANLPELAKLFELSGANIRNIGLHATLYAIHENSVVVSNDHIVKAIRREYQKLDNSYRARQQIGTWLNVVG